MYGLCQLALSAQRPGRNTQVGRNYPRKCQLQVVDYLQCSEQMEKMNTWFKGCRSPQPRPGKYSKYGKYHKYNTAQPSTTQHTENRTGSSKRRNETVPLGGLGPQDPTKWGPGAMPQRQPFPEARNG